MLFLWTLRKTNVKPVLFLLPKQNQCKAIAFSLDPKQNNCKTNALLLDPKQNQCETSVFVGPYDDAS